MSNITQSTDWPESGPLSSLGIMQCSECHRTFDPIDEVDAEEWAYGHDCELQS